MLRKQWKLRTSPFSFSYSMPAPSKSLRKRLATFDFVGILNTGSSGRSLLVRLRNGSMRSGCNWMRSCLPRLDFLASMRTVGGLLVRSNEERVRLASLLERKPVYLATRYSSLRSAACILDCLCLGCLSLCRWFSIAEGVIC